MGRRILSALAATAALSVSLIAGLAAQPAAQPAAQSKAICPIAEEDLTKAVRAFSEMTTVFQDRRCANCHGAVNPFVEGGGHVGGVINLRVSMSTFASNPAALSQAMTGPDGQRPTASQLKDAGDAARTILSADPPPTDSAAIAEILELGGIEEAAGGVCAECHQHTPVHWRVAKSRFAGKSQEQLCEMFQAKMDPSEFLGHVTSDGTNFVQAGFAGRRGLTPFGQGVLKEETGRAYAPEPVRAMTPDAFIAASNRWIEALDARFRKPPDCGCRNVRYALEGTFDFKVRAAESGGIGTVDSTQAFSAPMKFLADGAFEALTTVPFTVKTHVEMEGKTCDIEQPHVETWTIRGRVNEDTRQMTQHVTIRDVAQPAMMVCVLDRVYRVPVPGATTESDLQEYDFTMPATVGEKKHFSFPFEHGTREMTLEVKERPS